MSIAVAQRSHDLCDQDPPLDALRKHLQGILSIIRQTPFRKDELLNVVSSFSRWCKAGYPVDENWETPRPMDDRSASPNIDCTRPSPSSKRVRSVSDTHDDQIESVSAPSPSITGQDPSRPIKKHKASLTTTTSPELFQSDLVAMSQDFSSIQVQSARDDFFQRILQLQRDNSSSVLFPPKKAAQLTAFFFEHCQVEQALERLVQFIGGYTPKRDSPDMGASTRAQKLAGNPNLPDYIRLFCAAFSLSNANHGRTNKTISHIAEVNRARQTLQRYHEACTKIDEKNESTLALCRQYGLKTTTGRRNTSVAIDLLPTMLEEDRGIFVRSMDRVRAIDLVANKLGDPFILLTPPKSMSFLQKMSLECLAPACGLVLELCPYLAPICKALDETLWRPYINGASTISIDAAKLVELRFPWLQKICSAVPKRSIRPRALETQLAAKSSSHTVKDRSTCERHTSRVVDDEDNGDNASTDSPLVIEENEDDFGDEPCDMIVSWCQGASRRR